MLYVAPQHRDRIYSSLFTINGSVQFEKKKRTKENNNLTKSTIYNNNHNVYRQ